MILKIGNWRLGKQFSCGGPDYSCHHYLENKTNGWKLLELHKGKCTCSYCVKAKGQLWGYWQPELPGWYTLFFGWFGYRWYYRWCTPIDHY